MSETDDFCCRLCHAPMLIPVGYEPTELCNTCAQSEVSRLSEALEQAQTNAAAWHKATEVAGTLLELPHAGLSPTEFSAAVQEWERNNRAERHALRDELEQAQRERGALAATIQASNDDIVQICQGIRCPEKERDQRCNACPMDYIIDVDLAESALQQARAEERERWIPVTERLPQDGQVVDTLMIDGNRYCDVTFRANQKWLWRYEGEDATYWEPAGDATHWMPLPEPPALSPSDEQKSERVSVPEVDRLRREQSEAVMPLIGPLLDAWDGLPNDEKNPDSTLFRTIEKIARAMEGT